MRANPFRRVLRGGPGLHEQLLLYASGVASAVLIPLLLIVFGLFIQLLAGTSQARFAQDRVLEPFVSGRWITWPPFGHADLGLVTLIGIGFLLALLFTLVLMLFHRSVERAAHRRCYSLRQQIHEQTFRLGSPELLGGQRSRPEELFSEKVESIRVGLVAWWRGVAWCAVALVLLMLLAFALHFWLAMLAVLLSASIWRAYVLLRAWEGRRTRNWRDRAAIEESRLLDTLRLAPLAAGYALHGSPGGVFEETLTRYEQMKMHQRWPRIVVTVTMLLIALVSGTFLALVIGFNVLATPPTMSLAGSLVLGVTLVAAYFPSARLLELPARLHEAARAAGEVYTYLDRGASVIERKDARPLGRLAQAIEFRNVTVADRAGRHLLDNVSLTIPAGRRVAILASDPQTPLALAGLLVRYYDPASGHILYDGQPINEATLDTVRGQALLVTARGSIFRGTVNENIACGETGFTTLQITDATRQTRALDVVQRLPDGFGSVIGNHEVRLRGDERLRIALTRAVLRSPTLLIVEEPAEEFDEEADRELGAALDAVAEGRTLIVLPTRLRTLRSADHIYLFHQGKLHAEGTHAELIQNSELYRHINYVRFNPFRHTVS